LRDEGARLTTPTLGDASAEPIFTESEPSPGVVANSAWLMLAQGIVALIAGVVSIYAIRTFTTSDWGHYSTALALVALFTIFSGSGLAPLALREMTAAPGRQGEILGTTLQALAWTFVPAVIALIATAAILGYPRDVFVLVLVLSPSLFLDPALNNLGAAFNARSRLFYVALFQVAQAVVYGVVAVVVIAGSFGVTGLAVATVAASSAAAIFALVLLRTRLRLHLRVRQAATNVWAFMRAAVPIAGINLVAVVYARIDILMLSVLSTSSKVAFYTVPYGLVRLSWLLPSVISAAFFPMLSRSLESDRAEARYLFFLVVRVFFFLSVPISLVLALSSPSLLPFVFGDPYSHSVAVLQIMAWTSVLGFQNYVLWYALLAARKERAVLVIQIAGLLVNVAINAFAIPLYGSSGAATALLISDLVVVAGQVVLVHRGLFAIPFTELLAKPGIAGIVVVPIAALIATRSAAAGAAIGALAYVVILQALRYVTVEEWGPVTSILRTPFALLRRGTPPAT
jgi:O-antigen/teichoic acid export membrane protein